MEIKLKISETQKARLSPATSELNVCDDPTPPTRPQKRPKKGSHNITVTFPILLIPPLKYVVHHKLFDGLFFALQSPIRVEISPSSAIRVEITLTTQSVSLQTYNCYFCTVTISILCPLISSLCLFLYLILPPSSRFSLALIEPPIMLCNCAC